MKFLRLVSLFLILACAALAFGNRAHATTTCSATMTDLNFGTVNPTGSLVNASATLSYTCTFNAVLGALDVDFITACFSIGSGSQGSSLTPRVMKDASNDAMSFQMYTDPSRSLVWGSLFAGGITPPQVSLQISGNGSQSGTLTLYGQVPAGQTTLGSGNYSSLFAGANAQINFAYNEDFLGLGGKPSSCSNGATGESTGNFAFNVSALVQSQCKITTATDLSFGSAPGLLTSNVDQTSSISLTCGANTSWQLGLDNGLNASGNTRRMTIGGNYVTYELYRDLNRTQRWGNTLNTDTQSGTGTGTAQTLIVYGRVPPQTAVPATNYTDKITVTVTY